MRRNTNCSQLRGIGAICQQTEWVQRNTNYDQVRGMGTICQQTEWVQRNAGKVGGQRRRKGMNEDKQATLVACTYLV